MRNFFNNGRRPSIFEIATAYENGNEGDKKPRTKVVVNTSRLWYGDDSTVSAFIATAYDEQGNRVDAMNGYFLEPATDYMKANKEGSDRAIMSGTYDVITQKEMKKRISEKTKQREENIALRYDWYIDNVPGRSGIAILVGKTEKTQLDVLSQEVLLNQINKTMISLLMTIIKRMNFFIFFRHTEQMV